MDADEKVFLGLLVAWLCGCFAAGLGIGFVIYKILTHFGIL